MKTKIHATDKATSHDADSTRPRLAAPARTTTSATPPDLARVQSAAGNLAVQRMLRSEVIQTKLAVGPPGDVYEQEADRAAEQVMRMPEPDVRLKPT